MYKCKIEPRWNTIACLNQYITGSFMTHLSIYYFYTIYFYVSINFISRCQLIIEVFVFGVNNVFMLRFKGLNRLILKRFVSVYLKAEDLSHSQNGKRRRSHRTLYCGLGYQRDRSICCET